MLKILLIEDNQHDAKLITKYLYESNFVHSLKIVDKLSKALEIIDNESIDVVLLELNLPDSKGLENIEQVLELSPSLPVIVLTCNDDDSKAIDALKIGAQDYLVKDKLESEILTRTIKYAIERKRAEEQHQKLLEQRVRALSIIEAQENERRRISREIHDGLGQLLSAAKLNLGMIESVNSLNQKSKEIITQIENIITKSIIEARRIAHDLRPTTLDDFGMIPALRLLCQEFSKITGINVKLQISPDIGRIDPKMEIAIYRIIQESFNNISKYAEATEVSLDIFKADDKVYVKVKDNGKGFDPTIIQRNKKAGGGFGLLNMKERAELVGGKVEIGSVPGQGTEVSLEIDLNFFNNNLH